MSDIPSSLIAPIDPDLGGVLLANMLEAWLDAYPYDLATAEVTDELEDHRTAPEQTRLHLCAPVDARSSPPPSGEHRAPVCPATEGTGTGLARSDRPHTRSRPGDIGGSDDGAHGFQDLGSRCFDGASGSSICSGGLATGTLECRLVSTAGVVRPDPDAGDRRRRLLRSSGFQRWTVVRAQGDHGASGVALSTRAPPRR